MAKTERMTRRLGALFIASYIVACGGGDTWRRTHAPSTTSSSAVAARDAKHPPELRVVLNDPRLVAARDFQIARDFSAAARVVDDERARPPTDAAATCAWAYVSGRLHALANESAAAAGSFDVVVAKKDCALAPFATLRASQAYAKAGNWPLSLQRAQAVPDDFLLHDEARVTLAEALAGNGARPQAVAIWRDLLANHPHGNRWVDTAVRLAIALLDGVDGDANSKAHEAYDLTTRVFVEAPKLSDGSGATALRLRAAALIHATDSSFVTDLDDDALSRQIQAWIDSGDAQKGVDDFNHTLQSRSQKLPPPSCKLMVTRAQAMMKTKALSADAWGEAIHSCAGQDDLAVALYNGGRSSVSAKKNSDAIERFEKLESLFPHHRLADDASERAALVYQDEGDSTKAEAKLLQIPDLYPDGDMSGDALFRVALSRMIRGDWQSAKDPLDRAIAFEADDRKPVSAARASYFRARAADAMGEHDDAVTRYEQIIEQFPFTYFMLQAYGRIAATDADLAKKTMDHAITQAEASPPDANAPADLFSDHANRARALLEVGEIDAAHQELASLLSATSSDGADYDLTCALGELFEDAGASDVGYALVHTREYAAHYPAGKWKRAWRVAYPRPFLSFVMRESGPDGTPMTLAYGIMREESRYFPDAKSPANAFGLMQLIPPTARLVAQGTNLPSDAESLTRADVSIALGVRMLGQLRASNVLNPHLAIPSYNAGPGAVQRWLTARPAEDFDLWVEQIPFDETRAYIKKVLASQATYAFLYDAGALADLLALPAHVSGGK
jgi:soluble lytic murein transglycosylase